MKHDDVQRVMEDPVALELLAAPIPARLAYIAVDGAPRVVPVGIYWNGGEFVVGTTTNSAKVASLRVNSNVALTIDTNTPPQKVLMVRGTSTVQIVDGVADEYLAGAARIVGEENMPAFENQVRALYDQMALITITPTWAKVLDFAGGRIPKAVAELAQQKFG